MRLISLGAWGIAQKEQEVTNIVKLGFSRESCGKKGEWFSAVNAVFLRGFLMTRFQLAWFYSLDYGRLVVLKFSSINNPHNRFLLYTLTAL